MARDDGLGGALTWEAKHGSVVASAHDLMTVDGFNEPRLGPHQLFLAESEYGERDERRPALSVAVWLQYVLDDASGDSAIVEYLDGTPDLA